MAKKEAPNKAQEIAKRIKEMTDKKKADLEEINKKKNEAYTQKEAAEIKKQKATEAMDLDAYKEAVEEIKALKTAIDMYSGRYKQISQQEYISEEESDKVIDSLLAYENELRASFLADIKEPLQILREKVNTYFDDVSETERVIKAWEGTIHANYRARGLMTSTDPITGESTDRMGTPVAVRLIPYRGCTEAIRLAEMIKNAPL